MQEKSIFLAKNQQVKREKMRKRWGPTEKDGVIAWNYEKNSTGLGVFFETPVGYFQINLINKPRGFDSKNLRVKFGVSHRRPP
jgi:hypothetical protein